jgi:hypothetical protein
MLLSNERIEQLKAILDGESKNNWQVIVKFL